VPQTKQCSAGHGNRVTKDALAMIPILWQQYKLVRFRGWTLDVETTQSNRDRNAKLTKTYTHNVKDPPPAQVAIQPPF
jgi:hypothetical protein